ncbi:MAG: P-II family nitrogen regulator [Rhodothermia bacterium]|nr:P-II family nitrogen regulator [Rhodothermia bacterium]
MKEVKAIVQPFMKEKVLDALRQLKGLPGVTVSEVIGCGKPHAGDPDEPQNEAGPMFVPKAKLEIVVPDEFLDIVVGTIARVARTGRCGDGKIFVSEVFEAVKIRTGQRGTDAV